LRQELEGYLAAQQSVLGFIHHSHSAAAQLAQDFVVGNRLSDHVFWLRYGRGLVPFGQPDSHPAVEFHVHHCLQTRRFQAQAVPLCKNKRAKTEIGQRTYYALVHPYRSRYWPFSVCNPRAAGFESRLPTSTDWTRKTSPSARAQGHEAVELGVFDLVHDAHPTATELLDDSVMRDGLANHCWETSAILGIATQSVFAAVIFQQLS
jgi:hypothetical protein